MTFVSLCIQPQTVNKLATILLPATCCLLLATCCRASHVSTRLIQADNLQKKLCCNLYSRKIFNTMSVTTIILQYRQLKWECHVFLMCQRRQTPCRGRLAPSGPLMPYPHNLNLGCWGHTSGSIQATFSRLRYVIVSRKVRWRTVLPQRSLVAPSRALRFH